MDSMNETINATINDTMDEQLSASTMIKSSVTDQSDPAPGYFRRLRTMKRAMQSGALAQPEYRRQRREVIESLQTYLGFATDMLQDGQVGSSDESSVADANEVRDLAPKQALAEQLPSEKEDVQADPTQRTRPRFSAMNMDHIFKQSCATTSMTVEDRAVEDSAITEDPRVHHTMPLARKTQNQTEFEYEETPAL